MAQTSEAETGATRDFFELDLRKVRSAIKQHFVLYVVLAFLAAVAGYAYSYTITPAFKSVSIVTPASAPSPQGGLGAIANQLGPLTSLLGSGMFTSEDKQVTIAILESRQFTQNFISKYNLLGPLSGYQDKQLEAMSPDQLAKVLYGAYRAFDEGIRDVDIDVRSGLINVSLVWGTPKEGAELNNALIRDLNNHLRDIAIAESRQSLTYLSGQLAKTTNAELRSALTGLIEDEMKTAMLANVREDYALKVIDPAVAAVSKSYPRRRMFLIFGAALGLLIGVIHLGIKLGMQISAENKKHAEI